MADEQVRARLDELRQEYQLGERRLREVLQQETAMRETLLRISGAIQVLEELLGSGMEDKGTPRRASQVQSVP